MSVEIGTINYDLEETLSERMSGAESEMPGKGPCRLSA
jgi:hypothetical protein